MKIDIFLYNYRDDANTKIVVRILCCVRKLCSHTAKFL